MNNHVRRNEASEIEALFNIKISIEFLTFSSFPLIHKVGNVGIFVQLLMWINWQWLQMKSILMQMSIFHDASN